MPSYGSSAGTARKAPTMTGTGNAGFIKPPALIGQLILIDPVRMDKIRGYKFDPSKPVYKDRLIGDVVVLDGPLQGEYPGMWWSQSTLITESKRILAIDEATPMDAMVAENGEPFERYRPDPAAKLDEVLAGRLYRVPKKDFKDVYPTKDALEKAFAANAKAVNPSSYFWTIETMSVADQKVAQAYYENGGQLPDSADEDGDPFDD